VAYYKLPKNYDQPGESHDFWELVYVDKGALVATAGGVIVDYFERVQNVQSLIWEQFEVDRMMKSILLKTFDKVWEAAVDHGVSLRMASYVIALEKVCEAKRIRGIFP
jgi:glutamate dehydrogenase (NAD(P)+)